MRTNFDAAKKFIAMKRKHDAESLSGPGSFLENAGDSIEFLQAIIKQKNIKTILDLGCGDWNWMSKVDLSGVNYIGWDCDEEMIKSSNEKFGSPSVLFEVKDIVTSEFPKVDLIICRDVLFHIDMNISVPLVQKIKKEKCLFMSTTFKNTERNTNIKQYTDFSNWGFYEINLDIYPFSLLAHEIDSRQEKKIAGRSICLYDFSMER